jgi:hypothetical protein
MYSHTFLVAVEGVGAKPDTAVCADPGGAMSFMTSSDADARFLEGAAFSATASFKEVFVARTANFAGVFFVVAMLVFSIMRLINIPDSEQATTFAFVFRAIVYRLC